MCMKSIPKPSLQALYGQEKGLVLMQGFCGACGRKFVPQEPTIPLKCGHSVCSYCGSAYLPCGLCVRIK